MTKTIVLIHGRHYKPAKKHLQRFWLEALTHGMKRDRPDKLDAFKNAKIDFVYFGDLSNRYLSTVFNEPVPDDAEDRRTSLEHLKGFAANQFTRANYRKLPGANPWMEAAADLFSGAMHLVRLSDDIIEHVAPDMREYWGSYAFGSDVREVFTKAMIKALSRDGPVCVVSHSLGTMIAYDVLWKLSYYGEYRNRSWNRKVDLWLTLGSPLGDETVKSKLKGAGQASKDRYPRNINSWVNIAAEDDFISHDQRIAGDFRDMKRLGYVQSIRDLRIHNLAIRHQKSNPHHGVGYLIHPATIKEIADWL